MLDLDAIKRRVEVLEKVGEGRAWPASHLTPLAKDARDLVAEVERLKDLAGRLASGVSDAIVLCQVGDFSNGNCVWGMDEGNQIAGSMVDRLDDLLDEARKAGVADG